MSIKFPVKLKYHYLGKYYEMQLSHASDNLTPIQSTTLAALVRMAASEEFLLNRNTNC